MELYTWEYEGKQYAGKKSPVVKSNFRYLEDNGEIAWHDRNSVTNLRPAKVVDKDAVVIDRAKFGHLFSKITIQSNPDAYDNKKIVMPAELANEIYENFYPKPPVTEPKGFGAIVEAETNYADSGIISGILIMKWVFDGQQWHSNGYTRSWQDLINPTILSEGLK